MLTGTNEEFFGPSRVAFEAALRKLGWSPGNGVSITYRYSSGDNTVAYRALAELLSAQMEVLVAAGAISLPTLRSMVTSLPVVALFDGDPVASGFATSMSRPGGNLTGVASMEADQELPKMMQTLREAFPRMQRLGVLYQGAHGTQWRQERAAAGRFGIELVMAQAAGARDVDAAIASLVRQKADAIWVALHPSWSIPAVALTLQRSRIPAISDVAEFAEAGGLMAFGVGVAMVQVFEQLARFVDKILRGAKPGLLPIESPGSPKLVINARTANAIGYVIPPAILMRTDRLID